MLARNEENDENLARRVQAGDRNAFACLVERNAHRYYRIAFRILKDGNEAEEMVQNAFLKFWQQPFKWDPGVGLKFYTWFYRVVVNLCLDFKRKQGRLIPSETLSNSEWGTSTDEALSRREQEQTLTRLLQELPERQRTALNLCFYEGLSNQEAAQVMGLKLKALQSLLMRAKSTLRKRILQGEFLK